MSELLTFVWSLTAVNNTSMGRRMTIILFIFGVLSGINGQIDKTLEPLSQGYEVVEAVNCKLLQSKVFQDDNSFLKRMAYVATEFGTNLKQGGIWGVPKGKFEDSLQDEKMVPLKENITRYFGINWDSLIYADLDKPMYSAIATKLCLSNIPAKTLLSINSQADWIKNFLKLRDTVDNIKNKIREFERKYQSQVHVGMDLVVVLDGSASVEIQNYILAKNFIANLVKTSLDLSSGKFGFIIYGDKTETVIPLNNSLSQEDLINTIKNAPYPDSVTATNLGIDKAVEMLNSPDNVPRVLIVMTDGISDEPQLTIESSRKAKENNITTFSIGIGAYDYEELVSIAGNDPSKVITVETFDLLEEISHKVDDLVRFTSHTITTNVQIPLTMKKKETNYYTYNRNCSETDLEINLESGNFVGYYSYSFPNPSSALYDGTFRGSTIIPIRNKTTCSNGNKTPLYISVEGIDEVNILNIDLQGWDENYLIKAIDAQLMEIAEENNRLILACSETGSETVTSSSKISPSSCMKIVEVTSGITSDIQSLTSPKSSNSNEKHIMNVALSLSKQFQLLQTEIKAAVHVSPPDFESILEPMVTCDSLYEDNFRNSGSYFISFIGRNEPENQKSLFAYCDLESYGGGWTIFQRRGEPNDVSFNRNWTEYKNGFGEQRYAHWLGLETLHLLTRNCNHELIVNVTAMNGSTYNAHYSIFSVDSENDDFQLTVGGYIADNSTLSDRLTDINGARFSANDRDNDGGINCSNDRHSNGFWFGNSCEQVDLNGPYSAWWGEIIQLKKTEMKIRRNCKN